MAEPSNESTTLKRSLNLPMITFYGVGTIVGGGLYGLVGTVCRDAGMHAPVAFLAAAVIAMFSAFSFGELSSRFPYSAGEARYAFEAFRRNWLAAALGWMVITTGIVSAATLAVLFAGFVQSLVSIPETSVVCIMVVGLGAVAAWGIGESATVALVITAVELAGLLFVFISASGSLAEIPVRWKELVPSVSLKDWQGVFLGAYVAFYSFVGFEDMVNVAEEVKRPRRNLPIAILVSLGITAVVYVCVTVVTVLSVPQADLIASRSPLSLAAGGEQALGGHAVTVIGMFAGLNGALVQIVMASRVAYGMANQQLAPSFFSRVHSRSRTPLYATLAATLCVLCLALWFPVETLAKATSTALLVVYGTVNVSLWKIKLRDRTPHRDGPSFPIWLPIVGTCACTAFLLFEAVSYIAT